jgi:hypothetical protein
MVAFISPLLFIIRISAVNIANSTIFLSYSSSKRSGLYRPSVSSISNQLIPFTWETSVIFYNVKYIPFVHLPALVKNYVPKAKFIKVDFPVDCGPITQTTITLSFLYF